MPESKKMKIIGVIPARYKSSRFPGKPLADIHGKPMIWWVYKQAIKVKDFTEVYVATDDKRIEDKCIELGIKVIMTSESHETGTDRVGEVAEKIAADLYVNIQGDEPLIEPDSITKAIRPFYSDEKISVTTLMTKIRNQEDLLDITVPKVVVNVNNEAVFLSRLPIPYPKGNFKVNYYKQVCVYGFTPQSLRFYCRSERGAVERIEDIEILRFIEGGYIVKMVEVSQDTVAVDTEKDLENVRKIIGKRNNNRQ
jgi:3-deoxy-manno-octulosonate cytidylyltransferase (CMP-KDO synthetase)